MKKIILLILLVLGSYQSFSQTPGISYQAVILNPNVKELPGANAQSSILANSNVAIRFTIFNNANNQEYQEYHQTKTDAYGMINLLIGQGTKISASSFEDIVWNGLSKKLKVEIDFYGIGNNYTFLSEQELTFMPQPALGQDSQAILDNSASIQAEVLRATHAESVIQSDVATNEAASILADVTLQTNIDNVQSDVNANEAKATSDIAVVQANIDANEAASIAADTALQANIDANAATTTTAIADLQADVDTKETASILADVTLQTNIDNVQADVNANETATQNALDLKVDKISGKGLSTEDYTTAEKTKLGAITGTNTGDQDISGIAINSSNIGDLTSLTTTSKSSMVAAINEIGTNKADLESPTFTGVPLAPTAVAGTNTTQIATTAFVSSAISAVTATNNNFVTLNTAQSISGLKTFTSRKINIFAQSYANTATMNIGFAPNGENLNSIAMGINALYTHGYGARAIAIGNEALYKDVRGLDNIGIGSRTLYNMTDTAGNDWGNRNIAIGSESGTNIIEGDNNTLIGTNTNTSTSVISNSVAIGYQAVVNANNTIQLGNGSITDVKTSGAITSGGAITGTSIVKAGGTSSEFLKADGSVDVTEYAALNSPTLTGIPLAPTATVGTNTTQIATTEFVTNAVTSATAGNFVDLTTDQTVVGVKTFNNQIIANGVKIGRGDGNNGENTAVGNAALGTGTGSRNSAFGSGALRSYIGTGFDNNTSVGYNNLPSLTTGSGNTSVGAESMMGLSIGTSNTSIGNQSLINTSGNNNIGVGKSSGSTITTGSNNTIIGTEANVATNDQTNSTAIGFQAVAVGNNTVQLGNANVTLVNTSGAITSGGAITGTSIVKSGGTSSEYLMADGSVSTGAAAVREVADEFSATASQTSFTLTQTPSVNSKVKMYINGIRISNSAYSSSGTTLTYTPTNNGGYTLTVGDRIQLDYYY